MTLPPDLPRVCVVDWGIGGFGFVRALFAREPRATVAYFSDSGTTPYGKLSASALRRRLETVCSALAARGVRHVVLACNAASTVAGALRLPRGVHVSEIIGPGIALVRAARLRHVGVVGGARTIRAGHHARALRARSVDVVARVAQPLSAHVEAGRLDGDDVRRDVARIVRPLRDVDAVLLACTHYPALAPRFVEALPSVRLLDPAEALARAVALRAPLDRSPQPHVVALTSGDAAATRARAYAAFGLDPGIVRHTRLF